MDEIEDVYRLNKLAQECHFSSARRGFWDDTQLPDFVDSDLGDYASAKRSERIALIHAEVSELLEAYRKGRPEYDEKCPDYYEFEVEAADVLIRLFDFCHAYGINIGEAVHAKMLYNNTRPYKHGKRF